MDGDFPSAERALYASWKSRGVRRRNSASRRRVPPVPDHGHRPGGVPRLRGGPRPAVPPRALGLGAQIEFGHRQEGEIVHLFLGIKALEGTDVAFCHVRLLISP